MLWMIKSMPVTLSTEKVERFPEDATTTQCAMYTNTGRHVRFAAASIQLFSPVRPRPRLTHHHQELFPLPSGSPGRGQGRRQEGEGPQRLPGSHREERKGSQGV